MYSNTKRFVMDRPPPYNPSYEKPSAPLPCHYPRSSSAVSSPSSLPEFQLSAHRRSNSLKPRRAAPPPPPPPPVLNHCLSGHGNVFELGPPPPYSVLPSPDHGSPQNRLDWSSYSSPSQSGSFASFNCSPDVPPFPARGENAATDFQNRSASFRRRRSTGPNHASCDRLRSNSSVPDMLPRGRTSSNEPQRQSSGGLQYQCLALAGLKTPHQLGISSAGSLLVIDHTSMTVCVFRQAGQKISEFRVVGVHGGCFLTEQRLAFATVRGITICQLDGRVVHDITAIGTVFSTKPYCFGFIAVQKQQIMLYSGSTYEMSKIISSRKKSGMLRRAHSFKLITDVAVDTRRNICVLDGGCQTLFTIDENGIVQAQICISDSSLTCGPVTAAFSIAVDKNNAVILSDQGNRRVLRISPDGLFVSCLVDFSKETENSGRSSLDVLNYTAVVNTSSELFVIVSCRQKYEVRIYSV